MSQMLCIGYGQLPPTIECEMKAAMLGTSVGQVLWVFSIGMLTSLLQQQDADKAQYKSKVEQVREYMQFRRIPHKIRLEILEYYETRFQGKVFDEGAILQELNPILRTQIIQYNCLDKIKKVPFFKNTIDKFKDALIAKLSFEVYVDGDVIIKEGQQGRGMYFLAKGRVAIVSSQFRLQQYKGKNAFFGELSLIDPFIIRTASVYADETCYVYELACEDFLEIVEVFPAEMLKILKVASKLLDQGTTDCSPPQAQGCESKLEEKDEGEA